MSTEANKAVLRHWIEDGWNKGNLNVIDEVYAPNVIQHDANSPAPVTSAEALKQYVSVFLTAFPDLNLSIDDLVAEGDRVLWRFTSHGTHTGPLLNIPPTGRTGSIAGMALFRFTNGKIVEVWVNIDLFGLRQQLGVIPVMA